ncbi:putative transcriptional regulator domain protein [Bacteroides fragilis str. 3986T(B)10]|nr:putative transcriptional regulator domain protein [Bacteroides fragilis str. 3986T(B)10]
MTYCYGEVFEEELAKEAHAIIDYWDNKTLSIDEQETVDMLKMIEENQYPNSYID